MMDPEKIINSYRILFDFFMIFMKIEMLNDGQGYTYNQCLRKFAE